MKNIAIIYWSGTGNTKKMANGILEGIINKGKEVKIIEVEKVTIEDIINANIIALGCPAMGDEVLEEEYMEPFIASLENICVKDKVIVLFGAYGGGNGKWMEDWIDRMKKICNNVIDNGLIIHRDLIDENISKCKELGEILANY